MRVTFAFCLLLLIGLLPLNSVAASHSSAYLKEFERYVEQEIAPKVPGGAIAIVDRGQLKKIHVFGRRQMGRSAPVTPDTLFRLASVSKNFASTAAALLVEEGKLSWDSPVQKYLKDVHFKRRDYGQQLTLKHLLSHSTGLVPQAYSNLIEANWPYAKVVKRLKEVDFVCPPGRCYGYQNVVYSLAGDMIEAVSGVTYSRFVEQRLLAPLKMKGASLGFKAFQSTRNRAIPHVKVRKRWRPTRVLPTYYRLAPAAGVNASIRDMGQWLLAQLGQRPDVLSPEILDMTQTPVIANKQRKRHRALGATYYGLGWRIFDFGRYQNFVHHGGWVKGNRSVMVFNRELQMGMVFLTNAETNLARKVVFRFLELYLKRNP